MRHLPKREQTTNHYKNVNLYFILTPGTQKVLLECVREKRERCTLSWEITWNNLVNNSKYELLRMVYNLKPDVVKMWSWTTRYVLGCNLSYSRIYEYWNSSQRTVEMVRNIRITKMTKIDCDFQIYENIKTEHQDKIGCNLSCVRIYEYQKIEELVRNSGAL